MAETLEYFQSEKGEPGLLLEAWMLKMKNISLSARVLFGLLTSLSRRHGYAWPSQSFLASRLGVSLRTVSSLIQELKKADILDVEKPTPGRSTCVYRPKAGPPTRLKELPSGIRNNCGGVRKRGTQNPRTEGITGKVLRNNTPLTPQGGRCGSASPVVDFRLEEFEQCWTAWPIQQSRKSALRCWKRLIRTSVLPAPGKILAVITTFKSTDGFWKRGKVPQFHRWLRGHRWDDQPHISHLTSPYPPAPPGSAAPDGPEVRAKGQLVLVRLSISTGMIDPDMDAITRKIMDGYGGLHGLRTLPSREVGFAISGFVKEYVGLCSIKSPLAETPKENKQKAVARPVLTPEAPPRTVTPNLLQAVNLLCKQYPSASRGETFKTCLALHAAGRLPDPDILSAALPESLGMSLQPWLQEKFGGSR